MKTAIAKSIGTSMGFGYIPIAPGTWGAIFGVGVYYLIHYFFSGNINLWLLGLAILFTAVGTWCCDTLQQEWGDDPSRIVIDESVGVWITLLLIPYAHIYVWLGFGLFRLFDIWKPLGVRTIDKKVKSGFGVMLDDILAAIYAWLVLQIIIYIGVLDSWT